MLALWMQRNLNMVSSSKELVVQLEKNIAAIRAQALIERVVGPQEGRASSSL